MTISVLNTSLVLEPDFQLNLVTGSSIIVISLLESTQSISLNTNFIEIISIEVFSNSKSILFDYSLNNDLEELNLNLKQEYTGSLKIEIKFRSLINRQFHGFYKSNEQENGDYFLVSQFYETEARRAFPCFDLPNFKTKFDLELIIQKDLTAVFNTDIIEEQIIDETKKRVVFQQTPIMPTAILFIGVGKFDFLEKTFQNIKFRFVAEKPKAIQNGSYSLQFLIETFMKSQKFFRYSYPISKLDLIALDNLNVGAMENWGAISTRESIALFYKNLTTNKDLDRLRIIIAHEIAHQWFGNLVSPTNYKKYIWLNESFATYFGYKVIKKIYPEKLIWEKFLKDQMITAFYRDSFNLTVPIELDGEVPMAIDLLSSPIVYNKGGSILRQLANYVGSKNFKKALREYIQRFAYSTATSEDLWDTIEDVSHLPVKKLMQSWVKQAGHPIINAKSVSNVLQVTQSRFSITGIEDKHTWVIPLDITVYFENGNEQIDVLLETESSQLDLKKQDYFYFINAKATGFYHVHYTDDNLTKLVQNKHILSDKQKFILINDYFSLFLAGMESIDIYFKLVLAFKEDLSYLVTNLIISHLQKLSQILNKNSFEKIKNPGKKYLDSILQKIQLQPNNQDTEEVIEIRTSIIPLLYIYGFIEVINFGVSIYDDLLNKKEVNSNLINGSLFIGAKEKGNFQELVNLYLDETKEEMREKFLYALANITYSETKDLENFILHTIKERHIRSFFSSLVLNDSVNEKWLFDFLSQNIEFIDNRNFYIKQILTYTIIKNSKVPKAAIENLTVELQSKIKNIGKTLALAQEEFAFHQRMNQMIIEL